jgi:hypothetical protein
MPRSSAAKAGATLPDPAEMGLASARQNIRFPPELASLNPPVEIAPQDPVGVGKVRAALFEILPPVPELAVVDPAL